MTLSCVLHVVAAELSDGFVHVFEVQRKRHGLQLSSHTLQAAAPGMLLLDRSARMRETMTPRGDSKGVRVMSFNIWNYNGNWKARAVMIADVIEASGAGRGGGGGACCCVRRRWFCGGGCIDERLVE